MLVKTLSVFLQAFRRGRFRSEMAEVEEVLQVDLQGAGDVLDDPQGGRTAADLGVRHSFNYRLYQLI